MLSGVAADAVTADGIGAIDLLMATGLTPSRGEARRLIQQGGLTVDDEKITDVNGMIAKAAFDKGYVVIKKGKKTFHKALL